MKYRFRDIDNGQLSDGLAVLTIRGGVCEAETPEEQALAERYGGVKTQDFPALRLTGQRASQQTRRRVKGQEGK